MKPNTLNKLVNAATYSLDLANLASLASAQAAKSDDPTIAAQYRQVALRARGKQIR